VTLDVVVDRRRQAPVTVRKSRHYTLFDSTEYRQHIMTVAVPKTGFEAFTFTFG
jgi:Thioredoxin like C-terminal domain